MKYLLDSNICIHFFRGKYNINDALDNIGIENCAISEITLAELIFGAEKSGNPKKNLKIIDDFINQLTLLPISMQYLFMEKKRRGCKVRAK